MRRFLVLIASCLLALSLGAGSIAHASEPADRCVDVELSAGHVDGDAEHPGDNGDRGDKATHQHAGCHGHHISTMPPPGLAVRRIVVPAELAAAPFYGLPGSHAGPALRPPIA